MDNVTNLADRRWMAELQRGERNQILATVRNAIALIDGSLKHLCALDEFSGEPVLTRPPPPVNEGDAPQPGPYPRPWTDYDVGLILSYCQVIGAPSFTSRTITEGMLTAAGMRRFHPVREYLAGLRWDGRERLSHWTNHVLATPDTDYVRGVNRAFLIGAVRRVMHPGSKHDAMLVFSGPQGCGKSTVCRELFTPRGNQWFADQLPADLKDRNTLQLLQGIWGIEIQEMTHLLSASEEVIKSFLTTQTDQYFARYARCRSRIPRQNVLIGTTNRDDYLRDPTGNRRFWNLKCRRGDPDWLAANLDQLWAEATAAEASGEPNWLPEELVREAAEATAEHTIEDAWDDPILQWLRDASDRGVTSADVLTYALAMPRDRQDARAVKRAAACMRRAGWESAVVRWGKTTRRLWRPVAD